MLEECEILNHVLVDQETTIETKKYISWQDVLQESDVECYTMGMEVETGNLDIANELIDHLCIVKGYESECSIKNDGRLKKNGRKFRVHNG